MFNFWLRSDLAADGGLAKHVKVGDLVEHRNAGWARVLRVAPQRDGTAELEIAGICRPGVRWWSTYHVVDWALSYGPVQAV